MQASQARPGAKEMGGGGKGGLRQETGVCESPAMLSPIKTMFRRRKPACWYLYASTDSRVSVGSGPGRVGVEFGWGLVVGGW